MSNWTRIHASDQEKLPEIIQLQISQNSLNSKEIRFVALQPKPSRNYKLQTTLFLNSNPSKKKHTHTHATRADKLDKKEYTWKNSLNFDWLLFIIYNHMIAFLFIEL